MKFGQRTLVKAVAICGSLQIRSKKQASTVAEFVQRGHHIPPAPVQDVPVNVKEQAADLCRYYDELSLIPGDKVELFELNEQQKLTYLNMVHEECAMIQGLIDVKARKRAAHALGMRIMDQLGAMEFGIQVASLRYIDDLFGIYRNGYLI